MILFLVLACSYISLVIHHFMITHNDVWKQKGRCLIVNPHVLGFTAMTIFIIILIVIHRVFLLLYIIIRSVWIFSPIQLS
jgi:hypothetical protein